MRSTPALDRSLPPSAPRYLKQNDSAWSVFGRIIAARARQLFDRAGQRITQRTLRIGVSARIFHPEPGAKGLRGKTLQYLEESIAHWVMSRDVIVFMIPTVGHQGMLHPSNIRLRDGKLALTKNEKLLICGGAADSPGWRSVPLPQAQYLIGVRLQKDGYFSPRFERHQDQLDVWQGPRSRITAFNVEGGDGIIASVLLAGCDVDF